jgi:alpha-galactosidase
MNGVRRILLFVVLCMGAGVGSANTPEPVGDGPVKVFILAGQSNMEGHGQIRSLDRLGDDPKYEYLLKLLKNADGSWVVRNDVTISYKAEQRKEQQGPLTAGWGASANEIGPEMMFGTIMGERYKEHVLLIKTAWGGKDVFCDFRSPSAGKPTGDEAALLETQRSQGRSREIGVYYRKMISEIKECLANIRDVVPGYHGQGYEITGMAWFQGWNDFCQWPARVEERQVGLGIIAAYPRNLANMIRDLRQDLGVPDLPVAIGEMGIGGHEMTRRAQNPRDREAVAMVKFRNAQEAVANDPSLRNVMFVPTLDFWDTRLEELRVMAQAYDRLKKEQKIQSTPDNVLPTNELSDEYRRLGGHWYCHYNGSAANYCLIGYALAQALDTTASLAPTPPMGWNSWNAFEKKIDEGTIKAIADAMVTSGMRDAGYTYLVLDDAWMASQRDEYGRLVADPNKFPGGMKAIGDYIHSKGLKFGLYEDRGKMTCQQLPGSLGHEQIDMATFAEWGVDYIKMDSCFAESNRRMSSEHYALFRQCIQATGRPMVLSISDFGNAAWAWGGKESAQLWRTSNDIYPWMGSIYAGAGPLDA